jgi:GTPase
VTRCGVVAIVGRPNVGKSTLLNTMVGEKVSITAAVPHTTRHLIRGIITEGETQVVLIDTPGVHRPKTALGHRLNESARSVGDGLDAFVVMLEATSEFGPGDRRVLGALAEAAARTPTLVPLVVVNKVDVARRPRVAGTLAAAQSEVVALGEDLARRVEYYPVSARAGTGVAELLAALRAACPEGPFLYPDDEVTDLDEHRFIAELVREQLVRRLRDELPHSVHCRVTDYEWPHINVEILVERDSQKGMVIGRGGALLKEVGTAARAQLPEGVYLELTVRVDPQWQGRPEALDRLGF